ncbi:ssu-2 homolog, tandem duplicate 2 isoform X1 [Carassius auratus]|uniref:Ssu-2 homolog, tandem duplicate 2 isoform X1 n=1 Tax=Carassius auratus TaxID=7957 RepID=A0A6P6M751_CARAU|nr:protein SSUH2 homolog isoform X1 [Carassius auratus]
MDRTHLLSDQDEAHCGPSCPAGSYAGDADPNTTPNAGPTAPPADVMPVVPGYERLGPNVIPPSDFGVVQPQAPSRAPERRFDIPAITEELAHEAFIKYTSSRCCYSSKPAREMVFTDLQSLNTYRYRLETFTESRTTEWDSEPYNGQVVDGRGVAPAPWSIPVPIPSLFQDCKKSIRIPHTSTVKGCHSCLNLGRSACSRCVNSGRTRCGSCSGMGRTSPEQRCNMCHGSGMIRCHSCGGAGSITCTTCNGQGKLLCFIKLQITWKNNIYLAVIDKGSGFPVKLLDQITGEKLLTDMAPAVYPVVSFPDSSVNATSDSAVKEHLAQFATTCRILQQRQTIELIPITRVHYVWNEKTHIYFVYGTEHKVFTKDYPAKCCCCSIL